MKELYINNKRVILNGDESFPFSYKISDLENIDIINLPSSKTVQLPRCQHNDDIFGYIADITRTNVGFTDDLISVSFNQIKKATYELISNSEIVSSGLLVLSNILEDSYECTLYDKTIEILTDISGDEESGTGFLNNLPIVDQSNNIWESICTKNVNDYDFLKPTFNVTDSDLTGTDIICRNSGAINLEQRTLETDLTPLQFRTFKCWDVEYAMPIKYVIKSINKNYNLISYDPYLEQLFTEVNFNCGKPKVELIKEDFTLDEQVFSNITMTDPGGGTSKKYNTPALSYTYKPCNVSTNPVITKNGKYYIELKLNHVIENGNPSPNLTSIWTKYFESDPGYRDIRINFSSLVQGQKFGEVFINVSLIGVNGGIQYESEKIKVKLELLYGVNTTITYLSDKVQVNLNHMIPLTFDFFPGFRQDSSLTHIKIDYTDYNENTTLFAIPSSFGGYFMQTHYVNPTMLTSVTEFVSTEFRTGDILKGKTIFPKIPIKDFIISVVKYFNLDLVVKDNKLHIQYKKYHTTYEIPLIDKIEEVNTRTFNFSQMIMSNNLPTSTYLDDYLKYNGRSYTDKIINTGYSIKKSTKKLDFGVAIPTLIRDVSAYGYDRFAQYYAGGYNRNLNGITNGLGDKITFSYLNRIDDSIWVSSDLLFEGNMNSSDLATTPTEVKWVNVSDCLINTTGDIYEYNTTSTSKTIHKSFYWTQSPYKWDDITIIASLEMNKPLYSLANVGDINYPEDVTHYSIYFKNMIEDKFNSNTHILKTKMLLYNFDRYSIYNIGNSNYIMSGLDEWDPTQPDLYDCYLMRVNDKSKYISPIGTWGLPIELIETSSNYKGLWDFYYPYVYGDIVKFNGVYYTGKLDVPLEQTRPDYYPTLWRRLYL